MQPNMDEIADISRILGPNKVIGHIDEVSNFSQDNVQNLQLVETKECLDCPYKMFKSLKSHSQHQPSSHHQTSFSKTEHIIQNNQNNQTDQTDKNSILRSFLYIIDPIMTLSSTEMLESRMEKFKYELCKNLDNERSYFKKMGFSRKKGNTVEQMKNDIMSCSDDNMKTDVLTYLCNLSNINLVMVNIEKEERITLKSQNSTLETDNYVWLLPMTELKNVGKYDKNVNQYIFQLYVQKHMKNNSTSSIYQQILGMKYFDLRKLGKFLIGEDDIKKFKKDDLLKNICEKFEKI